METNNETQNKKRLGRGLSSLFSENQEQGVDYSAPKKEVRTQPEVPVKVAPTIEPENRIWHIAIDKLVPGIYQPRRRFEKESLQELATSIKENGLLQPQTGHREFLPGFAPAKSSPNRDGSPVRSVAYFNSLPTPSVCASCRIKPSTCCRGLTPGLRIDHSTER